MPPNAAVVSWNSLSAWGDMVDLHHFVFDGLVPVASVAAVMIITPASQNCTDKALIAADARRALACDVDIGGS